MSFTAQDAIEMQARCDSNRKRADFMAEAAGEAVPIVQPKPLKRIRQSSKPLMNKLESEYHQILLKDWPNSQIEAQAIRLKLGNGIWYKPDFCVMNMTVEPRFYEVKGPHAFRGGKENLKVAASKYPKFRFILVWKQDGAWQGQEIIP